jgi:hypothetical protein
MSNVPNLSVISDNEWTSEELDNVFNDMKPIVRNEVANTNTVTSIDTNTNNHSNSAPIVDSGMKSMLDDVFGDTNQTVVPTNQIEAKVKEIPKNITESHVDLALDLIKSLDLIRIPEELKDIELTEEGLKELVHQTNIAKEEEFIDYMKGQIAHDGYMQDMFEYTLAGGSFADLPLMQKMTNDMIDYEHIDLTDEYNQQMLVDEYMSEGLNPSNDRDLALLNMIPTKINQLTQDLLIRDEAIKAQQYFINKINNARNEEYKAAQQKNIEHQKQLQLQQKQQADWDKSFVVTLKNKKWSDEKKALIGDETKFVELTTGEKIPMWEYKQRLINSNPDLFQEFLDFTSKFDIKDMKFKESAATKSVKTNNENISTLIDRINKKNTNSNNTSSREPTIKKQEKQQNMGLSDSFYN